jgi:hypothetical protein
MSARAPRNLVAQLSSLFRLIIAKRGLTDGVNEHPGDFRAEVRSPAEPNVGSEWVQTATLTRHLQIYLPSFRKVHTLSRASLQVWIAVRAERNAEDQA